RRRGDGASPPQSRQPIGDGGVSTTTRSPPSPVTSTATTWTPVRPSRRPQGAQQKERQPVARARGPGGQKKQGGTRGGGGEGRAPPRAVGSDTSRPSGAGCLVAPDLGR